MEEDKYTEPTVHWKHISIEVPEDLHRQLKIMLTIQDRTIKDWAIDKMIADIQGAFDGMEERGGAVKPESEGLLPDAQTVQVEGSTDN